MPRAVVESPPLEAFKKQLCVVPSTMVWLTRWCLIKRLDSMILEEFSNFNDSRNTCGPDVPTFSTGFGVYSKQFRKIPPGLSFGVTKKQFKKSVK